MSRYSLAPFITYACRLLCLEIVTYRDAHSPGQENLILEIYHFVGGAEGSSADATSTTADFDAISKKSLCKITALNFSQNPALTEGVELAVNISEVSCARQLEVRNVCDVIDVPRSICVREADLNRHASRVGRLKF